MVVRPSVVLIVAGTLLPSVVVSESVVVVSLVSASDVVSRLVVVCSTVDASVEVSVIHEGQHSVFWVLKLWVHMHLSICLQTQLPNQHKAHITGTMQTSISIIVYVDIISIQFLNINFCLL